VPRSRLLDDLTVEELRQLLIEKQRAERQARLEHFRQTGRLIVIEPQPAAATLDGLRGEDLPLDEGEESELPAALPRPASRRRARRSWLDRMLLLVEFFAVLGLGFVIYSGFNLLSTLNNEVASSLIQPTLTPTAIIQAVVLPSGHTPPNAPGGTEFNKAEIPEHLLPLVQSLESLPLPTPGPQQAVRIQIPAMKVDHPVVQGDGWEQLKKGVGQHLGTPNPGQKGNIVLSAHDDVFGQIFRDLDQLKPGDTVVLFTNQRTYTYVVRQTRIVAPTQVEVMTQTNEAVITLISCYPYMVDNKRIVVTAALQETP
jgi:sortase A